MTKCNCPMQFDSVDPANCKAVDSCQYATRTRDYAELVKALRECSRRNAKVCMICGAKASNLCEGTKAKRMFYAADAIEELLAFAKFVARQAIDTGDNDGVSAEILCRKLNKLGLIETDGEFWMLPEPPKGVNS